MEKLIMCRICLVENVRMHAVTDMQLQETFERLIDVPFVTADSRPVLACFFCYARLKQCSRLMSQCQEAEQAFTQLLNEEYEQKPLTCYIEYFGGFIRTAIENIDILNGQPDEVHDKEDVTLENKTDDHVCKIEEDDSDGAAVEKNPHLDIVKQNLRDRIPSKRKINGAAIAKNISYKNETVARLKESTISNLSQHNDKSIVIKEENISQDTELLNDININDRENPNLCQTKRKFIQKTHMNSCKYSGVKRFICDICQKRFSTKRSIRKHIITHTGIKPFQCHVCQKSFTQKCNLQRHIRNHTGDKPYKCDICTSRFSDKSALNYHIITHTGVKPFECYVCRKSFSRKYHLKTHIRTHTGEKPYKCDTCSFSFNDKSAFIKHVRTHTGVKPFKCDICSKRFRRKFNLTTHVRTHTGEKPCNCDIIISE